LYFCTIEQINDFRANPQGGHALHRQNEGNLPLDTYQWQILLLEPSTPFRKVVAVLHFSMAMGKHMDKDQLQRYLLFILKENERKFSIESSDIDPNVRLANLITTVHEQTGKQVVILIDEYDAPLLDVAHDKVSLDVLRDIMRNFYSPLKNSEPMLKFVFFTGITKFSQLSIFSELNNITNISMDAEYASICGITKEELLTQMSEDIAILAEKYKLTSEQTVKKLKENYDGYHFTWPSPDIFNPFSLLTCFAKKKIGSCTARI